MSHASTPPQEGAPFPRSALLRVWLLAVLAAPLVLVAERPSVGAIRWDAWSGGDVTREVEQTLSPPEHRLRLPWFASIDASGRAHIDAAADGIMEQEIGYARQAGLDYWAFLMYPEADPMSSALTRYLRSPRRKELGFCIILHNTFNVPETAWPAERARTLQLLSEPGYQKVGSRPLVFFFNPSADAALTKKRLAELRAVPGKDPYFAYMGWDPVSDHTKHAREGFDAVSAYAYPQDEPVYARHTEDLERNQWARALQHGIPCVPLVSTGWDKRPRQNHPVSWEKDAAYLTQRTFPSTATPTEIVSHLSRALAFVNQNPRVCPAKTVILYAWNEHDEGGWLCPTRSGSGTPDTRRIEAVGSVLR